MKINKADYKGRVTLGSKYANKSFELVETAEGLLLKRLWVFKEGELEEKLREAIERGPEEIIARNPELAAYLTDGGLRVRE